MRDLFVKLLFVAIVTTSFHAHAAHLSARQKALDNQLCCCGTAFIVLLLPHCSAIVFSALMLSETNTNEQNTLDKDSGKLAQAQTGLGISLFGTVSSTIMIFVNLISMMNLDKTIKEERREASVKENRRIIFLWLSQTILSLIGVSGLSLAVKTEHDREFKIPINETAYDTLHGNQFSSAALISSIVSGVIDVVASLVIYLSA